MIEPIISLSNEYGFQKYLTPTYCEEAADFLMRHKKRVGVITGFFVNNACETDGPLGALFLADVLERLGSEVFILTDKYCLVDHPTRVEFPITDQTKSILFADSILELYEPTLLISVERCGLTEDERYYNLKREDITPYTAKVDYLFTAAHTIGIGDRGNEIGFGALRPHINNRYLSKTRTTHLVTAGVSNWGVYGLLAYVSLRLGENLLPSVSDQSTLLRELVKQGFVDGVSGKQEMSVDGLPLTMHSTVLEALHTIVNERI